MLRWAKQLEKHVGTRELTYFILQYLHVPTRRLWTSIIDGCYTRSMPWIWSIAFEKWNASQAIVAQMMSKLFGVASHWHDSWGAPGWCWTLVDGSKLPQMVDWINECVNTIGVRSASLCDESWHGGSEMRASQNLQKYDQAWSCASAITLILCD